MNVYFLLEDSKSAFYVWPQWLKIFLPNFDEVKLLSQLKDNQYCVESGHGYPAIKNHFKDALQLVADNKIHLDYFVLVYDADDREDADLESEKAEFKDIFEAAGISSEFKIIVLRKCFESWLIGNRNVYPYDNDKFRQYEEFYNAALYNPEDMGRPVGYGNSISTYHCRYFQEMLRNSLHKNYSKGSPRVVSNAEFLGGLIDRIEATEDLKAFKEFIDILGGLARDCPKVCVNT